MLVCTTLGPFLYWIFTLVAAHDRRELSSEKDRHRRETKSLEEKHADEIERIDKASDENSASMQVQIQELQQHLSSALRTQGELQQRIDELEQNAQETPEDKSKEGLTLEGLANLDFYDRKNSAGIGRDELQVLEAVSKGLCAVNRLYRPPHYGGDAPMSEQKLRLCTNRLKEKRLIGLGADGPYCKAPGLELLDEVGLIPD